MANNYAYKPHLGRLSQLNALSQTEAHKKQQQSGLPSIYDHINTNTKGSKQWMNRYLTPSKKKSRNLKNGLTMDQRESMILNLVSLHDLDMSDPMNLQCLRH